MFSELNKVLVPDAFQVICTQYGQRQVIESMVRALGERNLFPQATHHELVDAVMAREQHDDKRMAIGKGIALPSVADPRIERFCGTIAVCRQAIDCRSKDGLPTSVFVLVLGPAGQETETFSVLRSLSSFLGDEVRCDRLKAVTAPSQIRALLNVA